MRVAILISGRVDHRVKKAIRDKERHCIKVKYLIIQEDITIIIVYAPNNRVSKYMRQKLIELQGRNKRIQRL